MGGCRRLAALAGLLLLLGTTWDTSAYYRVSQVAFVPGTDLLATATIEEVWLWDIRFPDLPLARNRLPSHKVNRLAVTADGRWIVVAVQEENVREGRATDAFGHRLQPAYLPEKHLVWPVDGLAGQPVEIPGSRATEKRFSPWVDEAPPVALSPDSGHLATRVGREILIWDLARPDEPVARVGTVFPEGGFHLGPGGRWLLESADWRQGMAPEIRQPSGARLLLLPGAAGDARAGAEPVYFAEADVAASGEWLAVREQDNRLTIRAAGDPLAVVADLGYDERVTDSWWDPFADVFVVVWEGPRGHAPMGGWGRSDRWFVLYAPSGEILSAWEADEKCAVALLGGEGLFVYETDPAAARILDEDGAYAVDLTLTWEAGSPWPAWPGVWNPPLGCAGAPGIGVGLRGEAIAFATPALRGKRRSAYGGGWVTLPGREPAYSTGVGGVAVRARGLWAAEYEVRRGLVSIYRLDTGETGASLWHDEGTRHAGFRKRMAALDAGEKAGGAAARTLTGFWHRSGWPLVGGLLFLGFVAGHLLGWAKERKRTAP